MKKFFTLTLALLASFSLWADTTYSFIKNDGSLNTTDFQGGLTANTDGNQTFESVAYTNYATYGGTTGTPNYAANKTLVYNCKTSSTDLKIYAYNNNTSKKNLYITTFDEAASAFVNETISVAKKGDGGQAVVTKSYTNTTNKTIYIYVASTDIQLYKVDITEKGEEDLKQAGEIGYSLNFNKSRACLAASTETVYDIDGMKIFGVSSNHNPNNGTELQIKSIYTEPDYTTLAYVEFTAPADCRLHVKDNNAKGYWVSQTLAPGADADLIISGDETMDITAGKWYIISSNKGAIKFNKIEFLAPDLDPSFDVSPSTVNLNVALTTPNPTAKVTFTGKNLTDGTYDLTLTSVAGLTATPTQLTVADGVLNQEVTLAYTSDVDVAAAVASLSATINEIEKSVTINYSASTAGEKNYINASVNIEGGILANGKSFGSAAALTAAHIETAQVNGNDSLNNGKGALRNESYLGLKFNQSTDAYIAGWVKEGDVLRVKFGNIPTAVTVTLNGAAAADHTTSIYEFTAAADTYVKLAPKGTGSKLVLKQVTINKEPSDVMYAINYAAATNGTVSGWQIAIPGEKVTLTVTPADGYKIASVKYNDGEDHVIEPVESVYSFTMPAAAVTVSATFSVATALDNTEDGVKAVKSLKNGVLIIEKNGKKYNVIGSEIR